MEPFNSLNIASVIARLCRERGLHYNNTKIQKLLYCCYGCVLAARNERLCDEYPRAWQYGPVFPRVFKYIQKNKGNLEEYCPDLEIDPEVKKFLGTVVDVFGKYTAVSLSEWTHKPGSPWDKVVNCIDGEGSGLGNFIPDDLIKQYFTKHVLKGEANAETS